MNGLTLRACRYGDLNRVLAIEKAAFPDSPYSRLDFAFFLARPGSDFTVAVLDGQSVGYVIAVSNASGGMIQSIAVSPDFRRGGIGEALMKSALGSLSKYREVYLLVERNNVAAISLYRKFSFKETGTVREGYYRNGADAIEMVRSEVGRAI